MRAAFSQRRKEGGEEQREKKTTIFPKHDDGEDGGDSTDIHALHLGLDNIWVCMSHWSVQLHLAMAKDTQKGE